MSFATYRTLSALRATSLLISKLGVAPQQVRNAKTAATPGILGLGGKVGKLGKADLGTEVQTKDPAVLPVEDDVEKLVTHLCGSNILLEGGEDVKLKPDSEYPDWIWTIRVGPVPHYSQLTENDPEYWDQLKQIHLEERERIDARKRF